MSQKKGGQEICFASHCNAHFGTPKVKGWSQGCEDRDATKRPTSEKMIRWTRRCRWDYPHEISLWIFFELTLYFLEDFAPIASAPILGSKFGLQSDSDANWVWFSLIFVERCQKNWLYTWMFFLAPQCFKRMSRVRLLGALCLAIGGPGFIWGPMEVHQAVCSWDSMNFEAKFKGFLCEKGYLSSNPPFFLFLRCF